MIKSKVHSLVYFGKDSPNICRARFQLTCLILAVIASTGVDLTAQSLLIDDFGSGDEAWSQVQFPDGLGTFDTSSGSYQFFMPESAKPDSETGALFLGAVWKGSDGARFSDGFWRTNVRAETPHTAVGMGLRVSPDNPFVAYPFFAVPELGKAFIFRAEDGVPPVPLAEMDIGMQAGQDWVMEAGAVGQQLSLKMWPAGTPEPSAPQLVVNDSTFDTGMFALAGDVFPEFTNDLSSSFDNVFFMEQSGLGDEISVVSPRGVEVRDGHGRIPGPFFPVRVQMLYSADDFEALPESHRWITDLSLRPDPTNQFSGAAAGPMTVRLSTTQNESLGMTYDENVGSNEVIVFDGQIHWQSDSSNQFDYTVHFSEPFSYDPADGNLLVDLSTPGLSGAFGWWTDNEFPAGPNVTFVGGDYQAPAATDAFTSLFPMQFTFAQVPEPSGLVGDFNQNGVLDAADIDLLSVEVVAGTNNKEFDLDGDDLVNGADRDFWVEEKTVAYTYYGDSNLDSEFNSSDFVAVFIPAKYETGQPAGWAQGDWNGDGVFDSTDFVTAFADAGYEKGPRTVAKAVPEPTSFVMLIVGLVGVQIRRRRRTC